MMLLVWILLCMMVMVFVCIHDLYLLLVGVLIVFVCDKKATWK